MVALDTVAGFHEDPRGCLDEIRALMATEGR
jgi:hypothetical protein